MEQKIIDDRFVLSYQFYKGNSTNTLFLFHGFGQTNKIFDLFISSVLPNYSVVSIDLFFHGDSYVHESNQDYISISEWVKIFDQILTTNNINQFSLLSYSIGSRFIVTLLNTYASRIDKMVLVAPDGFGNNSWFRVATTTKVLRYIFKSTMKNPKLLRLSVQLFAQLGLVNSITNRFIERNLESEEHREKIYTTWVYFRKLKITSSEFVTCIHNNQIKLLCICGTDDQLVSKETIRGMCIQTNATYLELGLSHHKLVQAFEMPVLINFLIANR